MVQNKPQENLNVERPSSSQTPKTAERREVDSEVQRAASEVIQTGGIDANEGQEGVEAGLGNVSEDASEDKNKAAQGGGKRVYSNDEIEAIRAKLLAALPPQEVMIREIRKKLYNQEKVLTKRMKNLQKNSHTQAFYLTIVTSQIRKVREYFSILAHATYEMIKHLWLKIVHGV